MNPQRLGDQKDKPTKIRRPQRWVQKDEKGLERADFGAYRTQKAGMPRKLAFWTCKAGFSYMYMIPPFGGDWYLKFSVPPKKG